MGSYNTGTHFIFGKHPTVRYSESHLKQAPRDGLNKPRETQVHSTAQMQATNFKFGPGPILPHQQYQSMYKVGTCRAPDAKHYARASQPQDVPAKHTHIDLGHAHYTGSQKSVSLLNHRKMPVTIDYEAAKAAYALGDRIKRNNFEYGCSAQGQRDHFKTVSQKNFRNQRAAAATLDAEKQRDLRTNHFNIGGPTANTNRSVQMASYRPGSALERGQARPKVNQSLKDDLRQSHWGPKPPSTLARPASQAQFVTSNMINYRWVEPKPF